MGVNGLWRYRTANQDVAHPGGAAAVYDVYAVASANEFSNTPALDTDTTDYNWYLQIKAVGSPPTGNTPAAKAIAAYRKVGEVDWDGSKITGLRHMAPSTRPVTILGNGAQQLQRVGCKLGITTNVAGQAAGIVWNAEEYDSDGFHDLVTNPNRITIPAGLGGLYLVQASLWAFNITDAVGNYGQVRVMKSGTTEVGMGMVRASHPCTPHVAVPVALAAGEWFDVQMAVVGQTLAGTTIATGAATFVSATRVSA